MHLTDEQAEVWSRFAIKPAIRPYLMTCTPLVDSPQLADSLLALVLSGEKRGTASRRKIYTSRKHVAPQIGSLNLVLDGAGKAACVIKILSIEDIAFDDVTAKFAAIEGEGDKTLAWWRAAHQDYFQREAASEGDRFDRGELIVCEVFECIWTNET